jgi:hypothetical protein
MVPKASLFTNMRVEGKVVHPNSVGSIMTGHWEWDDIDWSRPVANPTIFEQYRKEHKKSDLSAWVFAYASILSKTGESRDSKFGTEYGANVVVPPTIPRTTAEAMQRKLQEAAVTGMEEKQIEAAKQCAKLAKSTSRIELSGLKSPAAREFIEDEYQQWKNGSDSTSHDAFIAERAIACMKKFEPDVITVEFGEIDCAHYGSWSRYVEAIQRTDELTYKLWQATQQIAPYRDNTLMLILPDHGRELDREGYHGFVHHSDFYTNQGADEGCRKVWMLAMGPGIKHGRVIDEAAPITSCASTGLEYLGIKKVQTAANSVLNKII